MPTTIDFYEFSVKNLQMAFDLILWDWNFTESYKSGMWFLLWTFVLGWKVTWTRDAIQIIEEVQSTLRLKFRKLKPSQVRGTQNGQNNQYSRCKPCKSIDFIWQRSLN